jgi:hypothetical protein
MTSRKACKGGDNDHYNKKAVRIRRTIITVTSKTLSYRFTGRYLHRKSLIEKSLLFFPGRDHWTYLPPSLHRTTLTGPIVSLYYRYSERDLYPSRKRLANEGSARPRPGGVTGRNQSIT